MLIRKVKNIWKKKNPDPEYLDVAEEIIKLSQMIDVGTLTIEGFTNLWNGLDYRPNLFNSSMELSLMADSINDLIDLHYTYNGYTPPVFAQRIRDIVFQFGNGGA